MRSLARTHTEMCIRTLAGIAKQRKAPPAARIQAMTVLLERGWGKAAQPLTGQDGEGPVIVRIERIIVNELVDVSKPLIPNDTQDIDPDASDIQSEDIDE